MFPHGVLAGDKDSEFDQFLEKCAPLKGCRIKLEPIVRKEEIASCYTSVSECSDEGSKDITEVFQLHNPGSVYCGSSRTVCARKIGYAARARFFVVGKSTYHTIAYNGNRTEWTENKNEEHEVKSKYFKKNTELFRKAGT